MANKSAIVSVRLTPAELRRLRRFSTITRIAIQEFLEKNKWQSMKT